VHRMVGPARCLGGARDGQSVLEEVVLVVMGVKASGERELIDYRLAQSESEESWTALLLDLFNRGLKAEGVELFVHDGLDSLEAAVEAVYAERAIDRQQSCVFHKLQNLWSHTERKDLHEKILAEAAAIYKAPTSEAARLRLTEFAQAWRHKERHAVSTFRRGFERTLRFYTRPRSHWTWVMCSNPVERLIRELRRRTRPMGTFQGRLSADTLLYVAVYKLSNERRDAIPFSLWNSQRHSHSASNHRQKYRTRTWHNLNTWIEEIDDYQRLIRTRERTDKKLFTPKS